MKCKKCGHQNPHSARYCGNCRHELVQKQERTLFRKYGVLIISCVALCVMIGLLIQKDESPEKNESPTQVIELEQVTEPEGHAHIHTWTDATCTSYATCTGCGITNGFKLSHKWTEGTCLAPATCKVCGAVSTTSAHQWENDSPKTCKLCGKACEPTANAEQEVLSNATVESVIRERLPIATYAMTDAEKVYSYSDATLTEQTKQYYFNSRTDEIVILDISEDGSAMYVRYPSSISGTGYRERWFAAEDILGNLESSISEFIANEKTKMYRRNDASIEVIYYDMISKETKGVKLGDNGKHDDLIVYTLMNSEDVLGIAVTERMALRCIFPDMLTFDCYEDVFEALINTRPDRVLTKKWEDGGIKIGIFDESELYIEFSDSHLTSYPVSDDATPLANITFSLNQQDSTGFAVEFTASDELLCDISFLDSKGYEDRSHSFLNTQFYNLDGSIIVYLAIPQNMSWNLYSLTSIFVETHLDETISKKNIVAEDMIVTEVHVDYLKDIQSTQCFFTALDAQGNMVWRHITERREDFEWAEGVEYIAYINDIFCYFDNKTIVALDAETGKQLWKRSDFDAEIGGLSWDVNTNGILVFAGVSEPDLFVVNETGKLLKKIDDISAKYPYIKKVSAKQDRILNAQFDCVVVEVYDYWDGWMQEYRIDLDDYTCTIVSELQT